MDECCGGSRGQPMKAILVFAALAALANVAFAQTSDITRTADGHPDFSGVWGSRFTTTIERMPGAT